MCLVDRNGPWVMWHVLKRCQFFSGISDSDAFVGILALYHGDRDNNPANTQHLYNICTMSAQSLRRWSNIVQMLYKCFVFAGKLLYFISSFKIRFIQFENY